MKRSHLILTIALVASSAVILTTGKAGGLFTAEVQSGKRTLATLLDMQQYETPAVPVAVVRVVSGLSEPNSEGKKQFLVKEVIVENRSNKEVTSITLRWKITPYSSPATALSKGNLKPHVLKSLHKSLLAGKRQSLKLAHPSVSQLIDRIPNVEAMSTDFAFIVGVSEVTFEDGSTWKEEMAEVGSQM